MKVLRDGKEIEVADVGQPSEAELKAEARKHMTVERWQFATACMGAGVVNADEAKAWGPGNALPASVSGAMAAAITDPAQLAAAEVRALSAPRVNRMNPLVLLLQSAFSLDDDATDALFAAAAALD